jgi:3-oxoacyl-[acyl-carrier protein] reductase
MSEINFSGRNVMVVGGSSGIGNGIARTFLRHGANVFIWGTRPFAADYRGDAGCNLEGLHYTQMDVTDFDAVAALAPPFTTLDVLVLSQGTALYRKAEFEMEGFRRVVDLNLNSLMACLVKFEPMLVSAKGSVIIVSSTAAFHSTKGNPAYNASKTGAFGLTRTLGQAWAGQGIRVNGIAPGFVATKLTKNTTEHPARSAEALREIPLGRYGTPNEMGNVALFLASPLASYVVGQTVVVDGGLRL